LISLATTRFDGDVLAALNDSNNLVGFVDGDELELPNLNAVEVLAMELENGLLVEPVLNDLELELKDLEPKLEALPPLLPLAKESSDISTKSTDSITIIFFILPLIEVY